MNSSQKEINCVVCKAYLFEDDDVVHCPVCGAPHHRECYNKIGHCALEEFHGTENEYKREEIKPQEETHKKETEETVKCSICGEEYSKALRKCPKCSAPDFSKMNSFNEFDFLGGVPEDFKIEENISASEAKKFVVSNTHRYIPKFVSLNKSNKVSWNWMAFFFPSSWMLSRKMYKRGIIIGILTIIATFLAYPLSNALYSMGIPTNSTSAEILSWMIEKLPELSGTVMLFALFSSLLIIVIRVICGLFGDWFYKNYVISSIKEIKTDSEDPDFDYRKKGGVNTWLFLLSLMLLEYIPSIILTLI